MVQKKQNQKERKIQEGNKIKTKRTHLLVPLIVVLMIICIIAIICVVGFGLSRPQEIGELNKDTETDEEQISAATTTVQAGETYTVPKDGIYKIELHGGHSEASTFDTGTKGSKVIGYVKLLEGDQLTTLEHKGGSGYSGGASRDYTRFKYYNGNGGNGLSVYRYEELLGFVSGAPGLSLRACETGTCYENKCPLKNVKQIEINRIEGYYNYEVSSTTASSARSGTTKNTTKPYTGGRQISCLGGCGGQVTYFPDTDVLGRRRRFIVCW